MASTMSINLTKETVSPIQNKDDRFLAGDWLYWTCEFEKARDHFQDILNQVSLNDFDLVRCYKAMAAVEVKLKNYDKAIDIYNKELDILLKKCDSAIEKEDTMTCYVSIGKVYWLKCEYDQAIDYHNRALDLAESFTAPPTRISAVHKNLANIYTNTKKFHLALHHFHKALDIDHVHLREDHLQFGQTYANMGIMYQSEKNYTEALHYFKKARETWLKTLLPTHQSIEKIEKIINKVKSKLDPPVPAAMPLPVPIPVAASVIEQPINPDILDKYNIVVLWLDEHIGLDDNCRDLKMEFRKLTNNLKMVNSVDSCRQLLPHLKNRKLFCIIQGKHAKEIVPEIVQIASPEMEPIVYIFCLNMKYLYDWALDQKCIMEGGMFDHEKDLLSKLTIHLNEYVKQKPIEDKNYLPPTVTSPYMEKFTQMVERVYCAIYAIAAQ